MPSTLQRALDHARRGGSRAMPNSIRMVYAGHARPFVYNRSHKGKCNRGRVKTRGVSGRSRAGLAGRSRAGFAGHGSCCDSCANDGPCTGG